MICSADRRGTKFLLISSDEQIIQIGIGKRPDMYEVESMYIFRCER